MSTKHYISYNQVHKALKRNVGFIDGMLGPDVIIAIGRGGYIPASILRTWIDVPIFGIGVRLYGKDDKILPGGPEKYQWLDEKALQAIKDKTVLLVDEVNDSGTTLRYCLKELRKEGIKDIGVLVVHHKESEKEDLDCRFYVSCFSANEKDWIVYPWESNNIEEHDEMCIE